MSALAIRPADGTLRRAVIGSAVVHVGITAALFVVRTEHTILVPGPDVVQVSLVDASLAPVAAPAPAPIAAPEKIAPAEDRGVRIEKPAPAQKTAPQPEHIETNVKHPPITAAPETRRVALPYADIGGGMRGQVAVDAKNFEFAYYLQQVRTMIARNWASPSGVPGGTRAEVYFRVARDGSLTAPRLETTSGNDYFDQAALRAVLVTDHLPPLPLGYGDADLGIHFGFEYTGP